MGQFCCAFTWFCLLAGSLWSFVAIPYLGWDETYATSWHIHRFCQYPIRAYLFAAVTSHILFCYVRWVDWKADTEFAQFMAFVHFLAIGYAFVVIGHALWLLK